MGTCVTFTSLYGSSSKGAICSLLRINDFHLLLDCGWDHNYNPSLLKPVEEILHLVDAVLLSHADPAHLGALPYLVGKLKLQAPVFATVPVHKMGQMFMYDQCLSRQQSSAFDAFSLDDIDSAFQRIRQLKYQQQVKLTGKGQGISITAFAAGHLVGGAVWQILTPDEEQIVYALQWNHRKDRHLKRADLDGKFSRPALLITDAFNATAPPLDINRRDSEFLAAVTSTLRADGNVLIPSDPAGRCLEVALLLEQHWQRQRLPFTVVLLTPVAYSTLEFAKSQLEWMNQDISDAFNRTRTNPFEFRHVKVCHTREALWELPPGPRVVMASVPSLDAGMSLQLLVDWAPNPNNQIIFLGKAVEGTTAAVVQSKPRGSREPLQIQMLLGRRVPLEGEELREWQAQRQADLSVASLETQGIDLGSGLADLNSHTGEAEVQPGAERGPGGASVEGQVSSSLPASELLKPQARATLIEGFTPPDGAAAAMFPFEADDETREWTEYGTVLGPGDFRRITGDDDVLEDGSDHELAEEVPTRVVSSEVVVNVRAQVSSFDFEGLTDAHSLQTVLCNVGPRHLIITHGDSQAKQALQTACSQRGEVSWQVHVAEDGQAVDASSGSSSFKVNLSDALLNSITLRGMGSYLVAWLTAKAETQGGTPELLPAEDASASTLEGSLFVGNVKLSEVRKALSESGISSEFLSGVLICQKRILVRSVSSPNRQIVIEGPLCEDYYRIRDILYSQYSVC